MKKSVWAIAALAVITLMTGAVSAEGLANNCNPFAEVGLLCNSDIDCTGPDGERNQIAVKCMDIVQKVNGEEVVERSCQIPCGNEVTGEPDHDICSLGEACLPDRLGTNHYCKQTSFFMDINLLDTCVYYFLEDIQPPISSNPGETCALQRNLYQMLDLYKTGPGQTGVFNIFDVDACVEAFLSSESCAGGSCPEEGMVFCEDDDDCGYGLYCDDSLHRCGRDCGFIVDRTSQSNNTLERECTGWLTECNYSRGRCDEVELDEDADGHNLACQLDADCPRGAYCFLGECEPKCFRSLDCPDDNWYCAIDNTCQLRPVADAGGSSYDPKDYAVRFTKGEVSLDLLNDDYKIPLVIVNRLTRKQEFDNKALSLGYRLELDYAVKQDGKCLEGTVIEPEDSDPSTWSKLLQDCIVTKNEYFVTLQNPYGTVYANGDQTIDINIDHHAAEGLDAGRYLATLHAYFSNGDHTQVNILFEKKRLSGDFVGSADVWGGDRAEGYSLGGTGLEARLRIDMAHEMEWKDLLERNNIPKEEPYDDNNVGNPIYGYLNGNASQIFNIPSAKNKNDNKIQLRGLYIKDLGQVRLLALIDYNKDHCFPRLPDGTCQGLSKNIVSKSVFNRKIRRLIYFVGEYDEIAGKIQGLYREKISGLLPEPLTLDGTFHFTQMSNEEDQSIAIEDAATSLAKTEEDGQPVGYTSIEEIIALNQDEIEQSCSGLPESFDLDTCDVLEFSDVADNYESPDQVYFACENAFREYLKNYRNHGSDAVRAYNALYSFDALMTDFLGHFDSTPDKEGAVSVSDFAQTTIKQHFGTGMSLCIDKNIDDALVKSCFEEKEARCGLAQYRRALLKGWVPMDVDSSSQLPLFCSGDIEKCRYDTPGGNGPNDFGAITMLEHNIFYKELTSALYFDAMNKVSDAFYMVFQSDADELALGEAIDFKKEKFEEAFEGLEKTRGIIFSPVTTAILYDWPMDAFHDKGRALFNQIDNILDTRMTVIEQLIDIKRRIAMESDEETFMTLQHLMHEEYLNQVLLMGLARKWHGTVHGESSLKGNGAERLERGQLLIDQSDGSKNPLGISPNRVYFEVRKESDSDPQYVNMRNWKRYHDDAVQGITELKEIRKRAILALQDSLASEADFTKEAMVTQQQYERLIEELCGDPDAALPEMCVSDELRQQEEVCEGPACDYIQSCADKECTQTERLFADKLTGTNESVVCSLNEDKPRIVVGDETMVCARGAMGGLLQEKIMLKLQIDQIGKKVDLLHRQMERQNAYVETLETDNQGLIDELKSSRKRIKAMEKGLTAAKVVLDGALDVAEGLTMDGAAKSQAMVLARTTYNLATSDASLELSALVRERTDKITQRGLKQEVAREVDKYNSMLDQMDAFAIEFELLMQQLINVEFRIEDTRLRAQHAADRTQESMTQMVDALEGFVSGGPLVRNQMIEQFDREFRTQLVVIYKMTQAFIHRYNRLGTAANLLKDVYAITTLSDMEQLLDGMDKNAWNYCGEHSNDCDDADDPLKMTISLQELLYPDLENVIDSRTGKVLTVGQQFHNLVTSSDFMVKGRDGDIDTIDLEIPFQIIPPADNEIVPESLRPLRQSCNHIISANKDFGDETKTIGVEIVGPGLGTWDGKENTEDPLTYRLSRRNTDFIKSCRNEGVGEPWIKKYTVGYPPTSPLSRFDDYFYSITLPRPACRFVSPGNVKECNVSFGRDRSLAAHDWKFIIPDIGRGGDNEWIFLPKKTGEYPTIADIRLTISYKATSLDKY